jgi:Zn finger protein HypA/HybF involved in hydrogenase expression
MLLVTINNQKPITWKIGYENTAFANAQINLIAESLTLECANCGHRQLAIHQPSHLT